MAEKEENVRLHPQHRSALRQAFGMVALCVLSSVAMVWLLLATGVLVPDSSRTITENREKLVLQEGEIVSDVFKKVSPSTVSIITESRPTVRGYFSSQNMQQGAGSGVIISKDGYILTNRHVIPEGVAKVKIIMADGKEYNDVDVIGRDPFNDIAFLKVKGVNDLPAAIIGDSGAVEPGQKVVAIGNALGMFRNSVSAGIISGIGRPVTASDDAGASEKLENMLQTDAAINPGNSGGPLVNLKGEVIGINTAVSEHGQAIGFAIPINDAKGLIKTVLVEGKIVRPYLGVRYVTLDSNIAQELALPVKEGAYISGGNQVAVVAGSPAAKAGLQDKDIITAVNGKPVTQTSPLSSMLSQYAPGDKVQLSVLRDGKEQKIDVMLEAAPTQ